MRTYHLTRFRTIFSLMILLAVISGLVPPRVTLADDLPNTIIATEARKVIWETATGVKLRDTRRRIETTVINGFLLEGRDKPNIVSALNKLRADTRRKLRVNEGGDLAARFSYDNMVRTMFNLAAKDPTLKALVRNTWVRLGDPQNLEGDLSQSQRVVLAESARRNMNFQEQRRRARSVTNESVDRAAQDPAFAQKYDSLFAGELGLRLSDFNPRAYLSQDPNNPLHRTLLEHMRDDGALEVSLNELRDLARSEFSKINTSIDEIQGTLAQLNAQQQDLVDFMNDQQAREEARALAEAEAAEHELRLAAAESALTTISTLTGLVNPRLGKQIEVVGSSVIQIGETVRGWMQATAGLSALETLTSLSTVIATGNALAAVMTIVSLFGEQGPSPEQMILEEIGKLREQIDQLGEEMHDRFDRVDEQLNTIYDTMQERFDQIDLQLGRINGSLVEIQQSLLNLDMRLSRLERNNYEFLDALGRRPLVDAINGGIGYRRRTGLAMPYQPEFVTYENTFHTWGTANAFDALSAGPTQRDYRDSQVLSELNAYPLDANLNYLNGWLAAKGLPTFASKRLPSPRDWLFASRAYARLGSEWPEHMRRIDPQRQADLDAVGLQLETALRTLGTMVAPGSNGQSPLFTAVISYYSAKLDSLDARLLESELAFIDQQADQLQRSTGFDLYGGVDQQLTYTAPALDRIGCADVEAPENFAQYMPNLERYQLADYLKLRTVDSCITATMVNPQLICPDGEGDCYWRSALDITIDVKANATLLIRRSLRTNTVEFPETEEAIDYVVARWGTYRDTFAERSVDVPLTPAEVTRRNQMLASTTTALEQQLGSYQTSYHRQVLNGLGGQESGLQAVDTLRPVSVELAGAKKLLESFIALGMPQTVTSDDLLRSLLYSKQSLVDDRQAVSAYSTAMVNALASDEPSLTFDPRLALMQTAEKRRDAIRDVLERYTDAMRDQTYQEEIAVVANARRDMELARELALLSDQPQPPPTRTRIYLPLLRR